MGKREIFKCSKKRGESRIERIALRKEKKGGWNLRSGGGGEIIIVDFGHRGKRSGRGEGGTA